MASYEERLQDQREEYRETVRLFVAASAASLPDEAREKVEPMLRDLGDTLGVDYDEVAAEAREEVSTGDESDGSTDVVTEEKTLTQIAEVFGGQARTPPLVGAVTGERNLTSTDKQYGDVKRLLENLREEGLVTKEDHPHLPSNVWSITDAGRERIGIEAETTDEEFVTAAVPDLDDVKERLREDRSPERFREVLRQFEARRLEGRNPSMVTADMEDLLTQRARELGLDPKEERRKAREAYRVPTEYANAVPDGARFPYFWVALAISREQWPPEPRRGDDYSDTQMREEVESGVMGLPVRTAMDRWAVAEFKRRAGEKGLDSKVYRAPRGWDPQNAFQSRGRALRVDLEKSIAGAERTVDPEPEAVAEATEETVFAPIVREVEKLNWLLDHPEVYDEDTGPVEAYETLTELKEIDRSATSTLDLVKKILYEVHGVTLGTYRFGSRKELPYADRADFDQDIPSVSDLWSGNTELAFEEALRLRESYEAAVQQAQAEANQESADRFVDGLTEVVYPFFRWYVDNGWSTTHLATVSKKWDTFFEGEDVNPRLHRNPISDRLVVEGEGTGYRFFAPIEGNEKAVKSLFHYVGHARRLLALEEEFTHDDMFTLTGKAKTEAEKDVKERGRSTDDLYEAVENLIIDQSLKEQSIPEETTEEGTGPERVDSPCEAGEVRESTPDESTPDEAPEEGAEDGPTFASQPFFSSAGETGLLERADADIVTIAEGRRAPIAVKTDNAAEDIEHFQSIGALDLTEKLDTLVGRYGRGDFLPTDAIEKAEDLPHPYLYLSPNRPMWMGFEPQVNAKNVMAGGTRFAFASMTLVPFSVLDSLELRPASNKTVAAQVAYFIRLAKDLTHPRYDWDEADDLADELTPWSTTRASGWGMNVLVNSAPARLGKVSRASDYQDGDAMVSVLMEEEDHEKEETYPTFPDGIRGLLQAVNTSREGGITSVGKEKADRSTRVLAPHHAEVAARRIHSRTKEAKYLIEEAKLATLASSIRRMTDPGPEAGELAPDGPLRVNHEEEIEKVRDAALAWVKNEMAPRGSAPESVQEVLEAWVGDVGGTERTRETITEAAGLDRPTRRERLDELFAAETFEVETTAFEEQITDGLEAVAGEVGVDLQERALAKRVAPAMNESDFRLNLKDALLTDSNDYPSGSALAEFARQGLKKRRPSAFQWSKSMDIREIDEKIRQMEMWIEGRGVMGGDRASLNDYYDVYRAEAEQAMAEGRLVREWFGESRMGRAGLDAMTEARGMLESIDSAEEAARKALDEARDYVENRRDKLFSAVSIETTEELVEVYEEETGKEFPYTSAGNITTKRVRDALAGLLDRANRSAHIPPNAPLEEEATKPKEMWKEIISDSLRPIMGLGLLPGDPDYEDTAVWTSGHVLLTGEPAESVAETAVESRVRKAGHKRNRGPDQSAEEAREEERAEIERIKEEETYMNWQSVIPDEDGERLEWHGMMNSTKTDRPLVGYLWQTETEDVVHVNGDYVAGIEKHSGYDFGDLIIFQNGRDRAIKLYEPHPRHTRGDFLGLIMPIKIQRYRGTPGPASLPPSIEPLYDKERRENPRFLNKKPGLFERRDNPSKADLLQADEWASIGTSSMLAVEEAGETIPVDLDDAEVFTNAGLDRLVIVPQRDVRTVNGRETSREAVSALREFMGYDPGDDDKEFRVRRRVVPEYLGHADTIHYTSRKAIREGDNGEPHAYEHEFDDGHEVFAIGDALYVGKDPTCGACESDLEINRRGILN